MEERAGARAPARPLLAARWQLCATEPGAPRPDEGAAWQAMPGATTVAGALREAGRWSLDGPAQDFDAHDWWFVGRFDAPTGLGRLRFEGLATLAEVSLNGQPLLASTNMFRTHEVDAGPLLREHGNELVIHCSSLQSALARRKPRPHWRTPMVSHQQLRWLRTTLLGRTPGWSPPVAPVGAWRDIVWVEDGFDASACRLRATVVDGSGVLTFDCPEALWPAPGLESAHLVLRRGRQEFRRAMDGPRTTVSVSRPALWWPHTHGEPALYEAAVSLQWRDGHSTDVALGSVGFRTIAIDQAGGGFRLRINNVPVFCRGGGWMPLDPVTLRSTPQACRQALEQVRDSGMNMLRLAGTTVYEEDHFYASCDALGLLVWQDLMFASMDYPFEDTTFASDVTEEVRQQLQRLHRHASVAVVCGNSEVEQQAAMWGAPRDTWRPAFFHETVPALCAKLAPDLPYWPSSAHGGAFPHQANTGTTSYYGVGAYERDLDDARRSGLAFATECLAFANVPAPSTLERMPGGLATRVHHPQWKSRSPRDLGAGWDFDDVRDHYVQRLFGSDPARLRHADHDRYLALGRIATAEVMRAAFSEWRRPGSSCGGALLLQLRDLWPGAGWGVLDDEGVPKAPWHALRSALQPVAVLFTDEGGNGIDLHVLNETTRPCKVELRLTAWRDGEVKVAEGWLPLEVPAHGGRTLSCIDVLGQFLDLNHAYRFGRPGCDVLQATLRSGDGGTVATAFHFPLGLADIAVPRRDLRLTASAQTDGDEGWIDIGSSHLALGVHFDIPGWLPQDEHFHLAPEEQRRVPLRRSRPGAVLSGNVLAINAVQAVPVEAGQ